MIERAGLRRDESVRVGGRARGVERARGEHDRRAKLSGQGRRGSLRGGSLRLGNHHAEEAARVSRYEAAFALDVAPQVLGQVRGSSIGVEPLRAQRAGDAVHINR